VIAAAHAACFSMALALVLVQAGSPPDFVRTAVTVTLRQVDGVPTITKIALVTAGAARRRSANRFRRDGDTSRLSTDSRSVRPAHH
jgi:osmotically inducible protein OsmC